ncbi:uncharacterized protein LOC126108555 isoform X3 [Schistocerca cancellata]|uniref:uncharacterized protein LOC126108555 isoform X3 n=1 Tax=Schistocerca cancellata TaxID=274614 RepID=UPI0021175EC4|nr:uncharacterized protein LOC126108555 isoform X3 [Schistocerca cancellata]
MALVVNYVLEDPSAVSECANKIKEEPKERGEQDRAEDAVLGDPSAVLECASKIKEELKEKGEQDRAEATVAPFAEDFVLEQDPLNIKKEEDLEDTSLSNLEITNNTKQEAKVTFDGDGAENCNLQDTFSILESTNNVKQEAEITIDDNGVEDYVHEDLLPVSEWTNNIKNEPELTIDKDEMENNDMVSTEYASNTTWSSQIMEKFPSTSRGNVLQKLIHGSNGIFLSKQHSVNRANGAIRNLHNNRTCADTPTCQQLKWCSQLHHCACYRSESPQFAVDIPTCGCSGYRSLLV